MSLQQSNDMLRSLGLNVPEADDSAASSLFDHLTGYHDETEPTVMDVAGWDDSMGVDAFLAQPFAVRFGYAGGMGYDG
jgi:hypothetical protein